jgi:hypothetical protein
MQGAEHFLQRIALITEEICFTSFKFMNNSGNDRRIVHLYYKRARCQDYFTPTEKSSFFMLSG